MGVGYWKTGVKDSSWIWGGQRTRTSVEMWDLGAMDDVFVSESCQESKIVCGRFKIYYYVYASDGGKAAGSPQAGATRSCGPVGGMPFSPCLQ